MLKIFLVLFFSFSFFTHISEARVLRNCVSFFSSNTESLNPFVNAKKQLLSVVPKIKNLKGSSGEKILSRLLKPKQVYEVKIPVLMDNGSIQNFYGYRSQHFNLKGLRSQGGTRVSLDVSRDEVMALSTWMTWKTAIANIGFGGGKGGIKANPKELSRREMELLVRGYVRELLKLDAKALHHEIDGTAPDVGSSGHEFKSPGIVMKWMLDEYLKFRVETGELEDKSLLSEIRKNINTQVIYGENKKDIGTTPILSMIVKNRNNFYTPELGLITGKAVKDGGSRGRVEATGLGVYITIRETARWFKRVAKSSRRPLNEMTFAVQGFGNVGSHAALYIVKKGGGKVTRLVEWIGGGNLNESFIVFDSSAGLPIEAMFNHIKQGHSLSTFEASGVSSRRVSEKMALSLFVSSEVDGLVPAAKENQITATNAHKVKAKYIFEAANGPVTFMADKILRAKNTLVLPDVLTNAGGVTVSYFEVQQNINNKYLTQAQVFKKLDDVMTQSFEGVMSIAEQNKSHNIREAAYIYGVSKVTDRIIEQGDEVGEYLLPNLKFERLPPLSPSY